MTDPRRTTPAFGHLTASELALAHQKTKTGWAWPRKQKFNAKRTEYNGVVYDSKGEAKLAETLDWLVRCGQILSYERQVPLFLVPEAPKIGKMVMDFVVKLPDGRVIYIDFKGFQTKDSKLKVKLINHFHQITVMIVKESEDVMALFKDVPRGNIRAY